ncbi:hypothetical protein MKX54_10905 [Alkalihalobacillus sp. FSL R5-0424]
MIVGIDWGNSSVKVCGPNGIDKFPSAIGEYWERNLESTHGRDDMVFEYNGRKGFAGTLAIESDFGSSIMGSTKNHEDALLRVLLALHRYEYAGSYRIVVGQPIDTHNEKEKEEIKRMVVGSHWIRVNGEEKRIVIDECQVAAEGVASFWSAPVDGLVRIIDLGSATCNCGSLLDKRYLNKDSFTLHFGMETINTTDIGEITRGIYASTSKRWKRDDCVLIVGGAAERLLEPIMSYYPNASLIQPTVSHSGKLETAKPIFATAVGFYRIGERIYG